MNIKDFHDYTDLLLNNFHYMLAGAPFIFVIFQLKAPNYTLRNSLVALSGPGAAAGIYIYVFVVILAIVQHYSLNVRHSTVGEMLISPLVGLSGFFPAVWVMPITFFVSLRKKRNGGQANIVFAAVGLFILALYFWTPLMARHRTM
jgi:hypothetical protein